MWGGFQAGEAVDSAKGTLVEHRTRDRTRTQAGSTQGIFMRCERTSTFFLRRKNLEVCYAALVSEDIPGWTRRDLGGLSPSSGSSHPSNNGDNDIRSGDPLCDNQDPYNIGRAGMPSHRIR